MSGPDVSVLLVSRNTRLETRGCLASLGAAVNDGLRYEVIAVDNGSDDGSADMLASWAGDDLHLLRNEADVGHAAAVNQAYARAAGRFVLLLDPAIWLHPGSLSGLVRFLRERSEAAGVVPRYLSEDPALPYYRRLPTVSAALALTSLGRLPGFRRAREAFTLHGEDFSQPRPVPMPVAACLLLRRSVLADDHLYDEGSPRLCDDALLARSLAARGHDLWMTPTSLASHMVEPDDARMLGAYELSRAQEHGLLGYLRSTGSTRGVRTFQAVAAADRLARRLRRTASRRSGPNRVAAAHLPLPPRSEVERERHLDDRESERR